MTSATAPPRDLSLVPWDEIPGDAARGDKIAPNFVLNELCRSRLAERHMIDNRFPDYRTMRTAVHLAREILQPIRDTFGAFTPNSVYRCQELERALKNKPSSWTSQSQHTRGEAADVEIVGVDNFSLAFWITNNLEFDQLILEYHTLRHPSSGWVHVSLLTPGSGNNRQEALRYVYSETAGKYVYLHGLGRQRRWL